MYHKIITTFLLFLGTTIVVAQPTRYPNSLTTENGLPQSNNEFVLQDSRGYIWISSLAGATIYDGHSTRNLQPNAANNCAIREGNIQSVFLEDDVGQVWFTTDNYLHCYDPQVDCFKVFQPGEPDAPKYSIQLVGVEKKRWLWGVAGGELFYFDTYSAAPEYKWTGQQVESLRFVVDTLPDGHFSTILGCLWHNGDGVEVFDIGDNRVVESKSIQLGTIDEKRLMITNGCINGNGGYWLSTNQGLIHWQQGKTRTYLLPESTNSMRAPPLKWDDQTLLVSIGSRLWKLDIPSGNFTLQPLPEPARGKIINFLYRDPFDNLWIGVKGYGVLHCSMRNADMFEQVLYPDEVGNPMSIAAHPVTRHPLVTFFGEGIWKYEAGAFTMWDNTFINYTLANSDKFVFLDTPKGVYTLDAKAGKPNLLLRSNEGIHDIWYTQEQVFLTTEDKFIQVSIGSPKLLDTLKDLNIVYCLEIDGEYQNTLIGSDEGVFLFEWDTVKNKFSSLIRQLATPIIPTCSILDTFHNYYWVGGRQDLLRIDRNTKEIQTLSEITGVATNRWICAIEQDEQGNIWFSSHTGVYRYDPDYPTQLPRGFTTKEGLSNNEYEDRISLKTPDGRLWFGHADGLDVIKPQLYQEETTPPRLSLNDFWVMGKPYPDRRAIFEEASVTLPYYNNTVTFKMAALDYVNPEKNAFWVTLEGYDGDTTFLGTQQEITYVNLKPGTYRFAFSATNAAGIRNPEFKSMQVEITPPFWQTWWFKTVLGIILLTIVLLIVRAYINRRLREQRFALEKKQLLLQNEIRLQTERNRIADELHDDLGGKLSTILFAGKRMMRFDKIADAQVLMQKVSGLSLELIESMRSIIWAMDTEHDQLSSLFAAIRNYTAQFGQDNELNISIGIPSLTDDIVVHGLIRHNILLSVKECLNNSLKHAQATELSLKGQLRENELVISIADNGSGFDIIAVKNKGKGLKSLQKRMIKVKGQINWQSSSEDGTIVSIAVPLLNTDKP